MLNPSTENLLRQRIAELEKEIVEADEVANLSCKVAAKLAYRCDGYKTRLGSLIAENTELKRKVDILRKACAAADDAFDKLDPAEDTRSGVAWAKIQKALQVTRDNQC